MMPDSQASKIECDGRNCTISCIEGHALPDGSTEMQMICENDKWMPANEEQSFEPNCERKNLYHVFVRKFLLVKIFFFADWQRFVRRAVFTKNVANQWRKLVGVWKNQK